MTALSDPNAIKWRKAHGVLGYLWIDNPPVVFTARIDVPDGQIYPTTQLYFDTITVGAYTDVLPGMTVLLGTTEGADDLGRQRVVSAQPTFLEIGWTSIGDHDGELIVDNNAWISVIDEHRVWTKTPFIEITTGQQYKDRTIGWDADTAQPPVANCGVWYGDFVDPISNIISVRFTGVLSFATAPLATITDYLWDVRDGTITTGDAADSTIIVSFPPGRRWISLTVTDSNGNTHTAYALIVAAEPTGANAPFNVDAQLTFTPEGGKATFSLKEDAPTTEYPDGTAVLFWVKEFYDGVEESLAGQTYRSTTRFAGYIHTEPTSIGAGENNTEKKTTLECLDVAGKLATLPGFPQAIRRMTSPTNWYEMEGANFDRFVHYLLHWHSTGLELTDFYWSGSGDSYAFGSFSSDGATLYQQVDGRANATGTGYRLTSDSQGILRLVLDPQYQETGDRTSTVIVDIGEGDLQSYDYRKQRPPRIHWIRASAIKVTVAELTAQDILWAIAPGAAPGIGESAQEIGNRLCVAQSQLNTFLGNFYARQNAPESQFNATLTHGGFAGIEPAMMEWLTLNTTAENAPHRGLIFEGTRFLPLSVSLNFDSDKGTCEQSLTLEREIIGQAASLYVPPTANLPAHTPPEVYFGEVLDVLDTGFAGAVVPLTMAVFSTDGNLYRTGDFTTPEDAGAPTWTQYALGVTGTPTGMTQDAFSSVGISVWLATRDNTNVRIYYVEDVFATTPTVTLLFTSTSGTLDHSFVNIASERITAGFVVAAWYDDVLGTITASSTDGTTFTEVSVSTTLFTVPHVILSTPAVAVVGAGVAYVGALTAMDNGGIFKTTTSGASWAYSHGDLDGCLGFSIHIPFADNPSKNKMYYGRNVFGGGLDASRLIYYDGSTETDHSVPASDPVGANYLNRAVATNPVNALQLVLCGRDRVGGTFAYISPDANATNWIPLDITWALGCDVDSAGNIYLWGAAGGNGIVGIAEGFSLPVDDRSGNLTADFSATDIIGIVGG